MSLFAFPSASHPQFYFTRSKQVLHFFIDNFLFSGKANIQTVINIVKSLLSHRVLALLLKLIVGKVDNLPFRIEGALMEVLRFISERKELFFAGIEKPVNIHFIIRMSQWERENTKFVIILFRKGDRKPFTVVRVCSAENSTALEKEFHDTKSLFSILRGQNSVSIPEPVALHTTDTIAAYFEKVLEGVPLSNFIKGVSKSEEKNRLYFNALNIAAGALKKLCYKSSRFEPESLHRFFRQPMNFLLQSDRFEGLRQNITDLASKIEQIEREGIQAVPMHGDLWTGSLMYSRDGLGIIDWEFFTENGVPLWDFFSLVFHIGTDIPYFSDRNVSSPIDSLLLDLAAYLDISTEFIPMLFESYLAYNVLNRDTEYKTYWQEMLLKYWKQSGTREDRNTIL